MHDHQVDVLGSKIFVRVSAWPPKGARVQDSILLLEYNIICYLKIKLI